MRSAPRTLALLVAVLVPPAAMAAPPAEAPLGVEDCVRIAVDASATVEEAEAKVREWEARIAEVESVYYPKLQATSYVAPMYTVRGNGQTEDVERDYSLDAWGPYVHFEGLLVQPIWAFGRAAAGELAARERTEVERAKVREVRNKVALEVRKLYYARLFALSLLPTFDVVSGILKQAEARATELYDAGTGEVTQADRMRLRYGATEVEKYQLQATDGAELAGLALQHTMGLRADQKLVLADDRLVMPESGETPDLFTLLAQAASGRPEWAQAEHGSAAAAALEDAEYGANHPVLFAAGQLTVDWAPTRTDVKNPYWYDQYNGIGGGIAIGLRLDLDAALAAAKAGGARAKQDQVSALIRFASTGIPLQVRKAHQEVQRYYKMTQLSNEGVRATRKWMTFSAAAYNAGTGEAKDVLEGVAAYAKARHDYYDALQKYYVARAELDYAIGEHMDHAREETGR